MIQRILVCDRCGAHVSEAYRIGVVPVDTDECEYDTFPLHESYKDYCAECLYLIQNYVARMNQMILAPDPEPDPEPAPIDPADLVPTVPEVAPVALTAPPAIDPEPEEVAEVAKRLGIELADDPEPLPSEPEPEPKPKKKQYKNKTLYLMKQAGKSVDEIAEETGYSPATVYAKLKKFKEEGRLC